MPTYENAEFIFVIGTNNSIPMLVTYNLELFLHLPVAHSFLFREIRYPWAKSLLAIFKTIGFAFSNASHNSTGSIGFICLNASGG
jgi:hypothetical protein